MTQDGFDTNNITLLHPRSIVGETIESDFTHFKIEMEMVLPVVIGAIKLILLCRFYSQIWY